MNRVTVLVAFTLMSGSAAFAQDGVYADLSQWKAPNVNPTRASVNFGNEGQLLQASFDLYGAPPGTYQLVIHSGTKCETEAKTPTPALGAPVRVVVGKDGADVSDPKNGTPNFGRLTVQAILGKAAVLHGTAKQSGSSFGAVVMCGIIVPPAPTAPPPR
jgi:hypothetical protein